MSNNNVQLYRITLKETGSVKVVYKLMLGGYCNANDHSTTYCEDSVESIEEVKEVKKANHKWKEI